MVAGLNLCGRVWDYNYPQDDEIGGALPSGTVIYENIELRIQSMKPTQPILEQGIEAIRLFTGMIHPQTLDIENNNEIEITAPSSSNYYGDKFRILGDPQRTSVHGSDSRGYILVTLRRIERGRTIQ